MTVKAGALSVINGARFSSSALGASDNLPASTGNAGSVTVTAGGLSIVNGGSISTDTFGSGNAGSVSVSTSGQLTVDGTSGGGFTGISSDTLARSLGPGNAGTIMVTAGNLTILTDGVISSGTFGSGNAGSILVSVPGTLTIEGTSATGLTGITSNNNAATSSHSFAGLSGNGSRDWAVRQAPPSLVVSFWLKRLRREWLACAPKIRCPAVC